MIDLNKITIIDIYGSTSYKSLKDLGYNVIEPYKKKKRWHYRKRSLIHILSLDRFPCFNSLFDLNCELEKITAPAIIIIVGSLIYEPFLLKLRKKFPTTHILYSYSNIVNNLASVKPTKLRKYNIEGLSWDIDDCKRYKLKYQRPCVDPNLIRNKIISNPIYDVCFIGADKGRYQMVKDIEKVIVGSGFKSYIHITPDYSFFKYLHQDYKDKIPYEKYLEITAASDCIIDLVQKGQVGTTMRTMEAIFNKKKLISNNHRLKEYDFYTPDNIFIVTKENLRDIPNFLRIPYVPIENEILNKYMLKNNIEEIVHSTIKTND